MVDKIEVDGVLHDIQDTATKAAVESLKKTVESLRKTISEIDASGNSELADAVSKLKNDFDTLDSNVWYLLNVNANKIAEVEEKLNEIINDIGELGEDTDVKDIVERLNKITLQYVQLGLRVVALENKSKDQEADIAALKKVKTILFSGTHEQVKALTNGQLVPGGLYEITDYHATVRGDMEGVAVIGDGYTFRLVLRASTASSFDHKVVAIYRNFNPQHAIYIEQAWQVWYDIDNDTSRYNWASSNGKGVIYRMIDEKGNDCPYDFKQIVFSADSISHLRDINGYNGDMDDTPAFFYTFSELQSNNRIVDNSSLHNSSNSQNNIISPSFDTNGYTLMLKKNVFISCCSGNKISENCTGNVVRKSTNVQLIKLCNNNLLGEYCNNLVITEGSDNIFDGYNSGNLTGYNNTIGANTKIDGGFLHCVISGNIIGGVKSVYADAITVNISDGGIVLAPIIIATTGEDVSPLVVDIPASASFDEQTPIYVLKDSAGNVIVKKLFE